MNVLKKSAMAPAMLASSLLVFTGCGVEEEKLQLQNRKWYTGSANANTPERMGTVSLGSCAATAIAKDLVLTAAHCISGGRARVSSHRSWSAGGNLFP